MTFQRVALVTGGANGIGAAIGAHLARHGLRVVLADRDERVRATAARIGAEALLMDVADPASIARGGIAELDVLVNCAAIAPAAGLGDDGLLDEFSRTLDVNVRGILAVVTAFLPQLRRSSSARILNIGSVQGFAAAAGSIAYATSKGAVNSLTKALAVDLADAGILVNALAPGFTDTAMALLSDGTSEYDTEWFRDVYVRHGRVPLRRPASPDEIAEAAGFLVSEKNTYVTGAILPVDGGLLATF
ncbi:SDR family oxidoreductase [Microbacterium sp. QXD-8]|uniref:SDR family oxidoreductase n=1 Tax=Microbacterium psychrotolerans TaxID=3068321 RepID=A0ABU0YXN8_9MICO|nr:SDR family oxidoreductase [Microbacterium sp. QXD-8]MDQ7876528.1 SDR family oxidoreductase [Microbacterium sp. QXD-8]